ncbi:hypothetical protein LZ198_25820 [Myxococcus sp. K15C18031901]|uniref:hypothetical protein n=1 Tax=Myxococcus dinghuensis TaxID=2906761 RepID=UPI0020A6FB49|nr:hypothetical protein [Myxococcus dinghuensis]MCP3102293.1 hypothetical protein [Myxococcus dinghuensis]
MTSQDWLRSCGLSALVLGGLACGGDFDPEVAVSISQGVYGVTTFVDDVCPSGCDVEATSMTLVVRALPSEEEVATPKSDRDGFFQVELASGDYRLCTTFDRCTDFSVATAERVRRDYEMGPGPGWSK